MERAKGTMSFTAVIVACHIASADMCMTIVDNRGPYDTEDKCKARISEMAENLIGVWVSFQMPMIFKMTSCVHPDNLVAKTHT